MRLPGGVAAVADEGEGPAVVLVHGLPGTHRDYRWLSAAMHGVRVIRPDLPGFGATPRSTEPGTHPRARASFVVALADALDLERYVVVGHSMGGPVAAEVAVSDPRVVGLGLLASVGQRPHALYRRARLRPVATLMRTVPGFTRLTRGARRRGFQRLGFPEMPDEAYAHALRCAGDVSFEGMRRAVASLEVPTLVAWTRDDRLVEPAIAEELARDCPAGPRLAFPDGNHNLQKSRASELGEALADLAVSVSPR